jgi:hypothetical protein
VGVKLGIAAGYRHPRKPDDHPGTRPPRGGLAAQPAVGSVIAGATRPEQVTRNAAAVAWQPTDEDRAALDAATAR